MIFKVLQRYAITKGYLATILLHPKTFLNQIKSLCNTQLKQQQE